MDLSKKDRVFLINQYRILALLEPNEASHYEELIEILDNGYQVFYSMVDDWISDDMPEREGELVLDTLSLYRTIEYHKRNNQDDEVEKHSESYFHGFDGNSETEYMAFARFLIIKQGKFSEQEPYLKQNDSCNSHMPKVEKYRRMLETWKSFDRDYNLTKEQVLKILNS